MNDVEKRERAMREQVIAHAVENLERIDPATTAEDRRRRGEIVNEMIAELMRFDKSMRQKYSPYHESMDALRLDFRHSEQSGDSAMMALNAMKIEDLERAFKQYPERYIQASS